MADYPEKRFFSTVTEFIESLRLTFPDEPDVMSWKIKRNSKSIRDIVRLLDPHADKIRDMNMDLFDGERELLPGLDFSKLMNKPDVSEETRVSIWHFLQIVLLLGKFIVKPKEAMQTDFVTSLMEAMENGAKETANVTESTKSEGKNVTNSPPESSSTEGPSLFETLAEDLAQEIQLPDDVEGGNPIQVMQSMLNSGGLMDIISKVGDKLSSKVNDGQINEGMLKNEAQKMFDKMSNMSKETPGMPDLSKTLGPLMNMMQAGEPPDPKVLFQSLGNLMGGIQNASSEEASSNGSSDIMSMLTSMMGSGRSGEDLPDLEELQKKVRKDMRKQYREQNDMTSKNKQALLRKLKARKQANLALTDHEHTE